MPEWISPLRPAEAEASLRSREQALRGNDKRLLEFLGTSKPSHLARADTIHLSSTRIPHMSDAQAGSVWYPDVSCRQSGAAGTMIKTSQNVQEQARDMMHKLVLLGLGVAVFALVLVCFVRA